MEDLFDSMGAKLSDDRIYRYKLWRIWDHELPTVLFVGLNPSTADETVDDPTIRRCINFAKQWRYGGIFMGNLFAVRATDPKQMLAHPNPIGPVNDSELTWMIQKCSLVVACWGTKGSHLGRNIQITFLSDDFKCLGVTKDGHPKHPLYLKNNTELINWPVIEQEE